MTEDDDLNNVRYKAKYRYETKQPLTEEQWVKDLNARIKVLEKALVKSEGDYEQVRLDYWRLFDENKRLLDEISIKVQGATVDEAWQKYCEVMMPQKATHVYPLSGAMYMTFVTAWNAALKEKK